MAEQEERASWALGLLLEVKTLRGCEFHSGNYWEGPSPIEDAYRLFNHRVTTGQIVLGKNETRRGRTDAIKEAYDLHSGLESCPECAKYFSDD